MKPSKMKGTPVKPSYAEPMRPKSPNTTSDKGKPLSNAKDKAKKK